MMIAAHDKYSVTIVTEGHRYTYPCNQYHLRKIKYMLKIKQIGRVWQYLKGL